MAMHALKMWLVSRLENKFSPTYYGDFLKKLTTPGTPFTMYSLRSLDLISSGAAEIGEVLAVMSRIGVPNKFDAVIEAWWKEWSTFAGVLQKRAEDAAAAGHTVSAASLYLRATEAHRQSFFFLRDKLDDSRIGQASRAVQSCFQKYIELSGLPLEAISIPYQDNELSGYYIAGKGAAPGESRPVVIASGDYDGCAEEWWLNTGRYAYERGYHTLVFDGPGQGSSLWQKKIHYPATPHSAFDAAAAWLARNKNEADLGRVIIVGRKYGGYLAMHATATNFTRGINRPYSVAAVAVAPLYIDMGERSIPNMLSPEAKAYFEKKQDDTVHNLMMKDIKKSAYIRFSIVSRAACHGFGDSPEKWLRRYNDELTCVDRLTHIDCPVWVAIHTDKKWNHQVLDDPSFDKIKDLSVQKFSVAEDGTMGAYWEGGAASTMQSMMDFVEDKVPLVVKI